MRTARLLPVSPNMHCTRGYLPLVQGGGYLPLVWGGGCLLWGVPASGPRGDTCLWSWGVSAPGGVPASSWGGGGVGLWSEGEGVGVYPSMQWGRSPPVDRMTDTREKHNLHKLRLRMATSRRHYTKVLSVSWQNI